MQTLGKTFLKASPRPAARMPASVRPFTSSAKPVVSRVSVISHATLAETKAVPVMEKGELNQFPGSAGVYAVYDKNGILQYIGLSRKVI
jgi:hypothetical protein